MVIVEGQGTSTLCEHVAPALDALVHVWSMKHLSV